MSRVRKAKGFRTSDDFKEVHECHLGMNDIGLRITDLPKPICIDILLRLPLKCVLICRCVCKIWRDLVKDSEFVKLHFSRAESYPMIRAVGPTHISRTLYCVDQPPKYDVCYDSDCGDGGRRVNMKIETKLKIPLHNAELAMSGEGVVTMNHSKRKRVTKLRPKDHKLKVVNSCNGFLCLSEPLRNDPVMICNPVTGEFMKLPEPSKSYKNSHGDDVRDCGLGFCPKTNCYKVVRMFNQETSVFTAEPVTGRETWCRRVAEIHTLGTSTWKHIGYAPWSFEKIKSFTYLNGTLNWLCLSYSGPISITAFDFGEEKFKSVPIPSKYNYPMRCNSPFMSYEQNRSMSYNDQGKISIGELRGCLCLCDASRKLGGKIQLWVMKSYGVESSWNIELKISMYTSHRRLLHGLYKPMCYFKDGILLFFHPLSSAVFQYDPKAKHLKFLKVRGIQSKFEAFAFIPSFISLKDAMVGEDVEVYNVKWRCGSLKLQGESKDISLVEECADLASDFNLSSSEGE